MYNIQLNKKGVVRTGRTLSIMPTYQCNARCTNCGTYSNPHRKIHLKRKQIEKAINEAVELNFLNVVFTGGEPTLRINDLIYGLKITSERGLLTRIVTNAHWAKSIKVALEFVSLLLDNGLNEINFSTGDEHSKFIPLENIVNAILACNELGLKFHVMVERTKNNFVTKKSILEHPRVRARNLEEKINIYIDENPWMSLNYNDIIDYDDGLVINEDNIKACTGCHSILQTIVLQADGNIGACCGLGMQTIQELQVGHIDNSKALLKAITESENDIFKLALRYIGPEKILSWAALKNKAIVWSGQYSHRCQFCMRIYKDKQVKECILKYFEEKISQIIYAATFDEVLFPQYIDKVEV